MAAHFDPSGALIYQHDLGWGDAQPPAGNDKPAKNRPAPTGNHGRQAERIRMKAGEGIVYPILMDEIARQGVDLRQIAKQIGVRNPTLMRKLRGQIKWSAWEKNEVKTFINSELTLVALFSRPYCEG